jgi:hypothetical protein
MNANRHIRHLLVTVAAAALLASGGAWAQASQVDPKHAPAEKIEPCPGKTDSSLKCGPDNVKPAMPKAKTSHKPVKPRHAKPAPAALKKPAPADNLSQHLEKTNGTIQPPAFHDPGMKVAPHSGDKNMPVIAPPDEPGGNQKIVPK